MVVKKTADENFECKHVYQTNDLARPDIQKAMKQGAFNLARPVKVLNEGNYKET